jgi:hypothetical protein
VTAAYAANPQRVCGLRFEDAVSGDPAAWERVCAHLEIAFDPSALTRFRDV